MGRIDVYFFFARIKRNFRLYKYNSGYRYHCTGAYISECCSQLRAWQIEEDFSDADQAHHLCSFSVMQHLLLRKLLTRDREKEQSNNRPSTRKLFRKS